jgi:hypothetical protein
MRFFSDQQACFRGFAIDIQGFEGEGLHGVDCC